MKNDNASAQTMMEGDCYRFLAACFYQPKKEALDAEELLGALTLSLRSTCPAAVPYSEQMRRAIASYTEEELTVEYASLFVGPFALKAAPYGSIYLDGERTVMGSSTMETIRFYEAEGLARDESFTELPDHIAVELEFMYFLVYKEVESLAKGDQERALEYLQKRVNFRAAFLEQWVPHFCKNIKEGTDNRFYAALADCLSTLIEYRSTSDDPPPAM